VIDVTGEWEIWTIGIVGRKQRLPQLPSMKGLKKSSGKTGRGEALTDGLLFQMMGNDGLGKGRRD